MPAITRRNRQEGTKIHSFPTSNYAITSGTWRFPNSLSNLPEQSSTRLFRNIFAGTHRSCLEHRPFHWCCSVPAYAVSTRLRPHVYTHSACAFLLLSQLQVSQELQKFFFLSITTIISFQRRLLELPFPRLSLRNSMSCSTLAPTKTPKREPRIHLDCIL